MISGQSSKKRQVAGSLNQGKQKCFILSRVGRDCLTLQRGDVNTGVSAVPNGGLAFRFHP